MNRTVVLWSAGLLLALGAAPVAMAGSYTYTWSGPSAIPSDTGNNSLVFSNYRGPTTASGNTGPLIISDVTTANGNDATWTDDSLAFHLHIVDGPNAGAITMSSHFSSTLVNGVGNTQIVDGPTSVPVPLTLGTDAFTLKWDTTASAPEILVTTAPTAPHASPEPSSLVLALLGAVTPVAFWWRRRLFAA